MSGMLASSSIGRALEKLSSFLRAFSSVPSSSSLEDDQEELRRLERTMRRIRATLHDADMHWNIREESTKLRLKELKEVAYDAEDVVEEYEYEVNLCRVEALDRSAGRRKIQEIEVSLDKLSSFYKTLSASSSSVTPTASTGLEELRTSLERTMCSIRAMLHKAEEALQPSGVANNTSKCKLQEESGAYSMDAGVIAVPNELLLQTRKITERFSEIINYSDHFTLSEDDGEKQYTPSITSSRHTSSIVFEKSIQGRDQDKVRIVKKILSITGKSVGSPVSVMAIVGMGGLGKTTLAQLVYNDAMVHQSFHKLAWVYVSEHLDVNEITKKLYGSLTDEMCDFTELADMQVKLAAEIKGKRVLLVLDDVWSERRDLWELFCTPLSTARICQIIVTTRNEAVAKLIQTMPCYHLNCLSSYQSWSLFKQAAFIVEKESDTPANLIEIGKSIVEKCKGLPLAIKVLGSMLRYESDQKIWEDVLQNEMWDLEQPRNEVLPALELSFKHMPVCLRRCFLTLSLFPKTHSLCYTTITRFWELLDLIPWDSSDNKYETGTMYLKELILRSMLQFDHRIRYRMHDLIHDLACFLAEEEFYKLDEDTSSNEIPQTIRYLYIPEGVGSFEIPVIPHSLRALIVRAGYPIIKNPEALLLNCKKLRTLDVHYSLVEALPELIGSLKLLRHLLLRIWCAEFMIPNSMFSFYNLQTLELYSDMFHPKPVLNGIMRLTNLHTLPPMSINRCGCSGGIRELMNLDKIRELYIYGLGSVSHINDANEAQLQSKKYLRILHLDFSIGKQHCQHVLQPKLVTTSHDQLLESLKPYRNLSELRICNYEAYKFPSWLELESLPLLAKLCLECCPNLQYCDALAGLTSLKELKVWRCPKLRVHSLDLPQLETLITEDADYH